MKKLICLLAAIMLIFAVSCSNDNPSPDATAPVINAPEVNTNYSELSPEEKMEKFYIFREIVNNAYYQGASDLVDEAEAEVEKTIKSGTEKGTVVKSNSDDTVKVIIVFDTVAKTGSSTTYYLGYVYENYTIWGIDANNYGEYTIKDNKSGYITKIKDVYKTSADDNSECYLNDEKVDSNYQ